MSTDTGFALAPSEKAYQLIAFSSLARMEKLDFSQSFALPVGSITVFTPVGVNLDSPQLTDLGEQTIQNFNYHVYQAAPADSGSKLGFVISGNPDDATTATGTNRGWLIGAAVLGIVLIAAGIWMYRRDQSTQGDEEEEPENEFDSANEVMDAIIALDDLHTRKKISDKAYQKKRAELKEILKGMM